MYIKDILPTCSSAGFYSFLLLYTNLFLPSYFSHKFVLCSAPKVWGSPGLELVTQAWKHDILKMLTGSFQIEVFANILHLWDNMGGERFCYFFL